jgi:hypothetical protein
MPGKMATKPRSDLTGEKNPAQAGRPVVSPFPVARAVIMTDDELGKLLLAWFTTCEAAQHGLPSLDKQFADSVRRRLLENAPKGGPQHVEEALRLAARGDFASAGRRMREFLRDAGNHAKLMNYLNPAKQSVRSAGKKPAAGRNTTVAGHEVAAPGRRQHGEDTRTRVLNERHRLLNAGMGVRALPAAIARRLEMDVQSVREIIRTASLKRS